MKKINCDSGCIGCLVDTFLLRNTWRRTTIRGSVQLKAARYSIPTALEELDDAKDHEGGTACLLDYWKNLEDFNMDTMCEHVHLKGHPFDGNWKQVWLELKITIHSGSVVLTFLCLSIHSGQMIRWNCAWSFGSLVPTRDESVLFQVPATDKGSIDI